MAVAFDTGVLLTLVVSVLDRPDARSIAIWRFVS
jgi:hypothetical protein